MGLDLLEPIHEESLQGLVMHKSMTALLTFCCFIFITILADSLRADDPPTQKTPAKPPKAYGKNLEKVDVIPPEWKYSAAQKLTSAEVDSVLNQMLQKEGLKPAPLTSDEQFVRRVYLDLTGKLPDPATIKSFATDKSTNKRSLLIDKLLAKIGRASCRERV